MLPCKSEGENDSTSEEETHRKLLWFDRRFLAAGSIAPSCKTVSVSVAQLILGYSKRKSNVIWPISLLTPSIQ